MSAARPRGGYWPIQLLRASLALVVGLVITFSADHTALFGLIVFGAFSFTSGLVLGWGALRLVDRHLRVSSFVLAAVAVVCGISGFVFSPAGPGALFLLVIIFGATTGFLEIYLGLRSRDNHEATRDWLTVGSLTALLAIAVLLVPADYALPWSVVEKGATVSGLLTSQIIIVGILGAYAILVGVYLVIGGLSARWTNTSEREPTDTVTGR